MNGSAYFDHLFERASDHLAAGHVQRAIDLLTELLGAQPEHPEAHALLAMALIENKRLYAARHEAHLALSHAPDSPLAHHAMAVVLVASRRFREAMEHLDNELALDPESVVALQLHARIAKLRGRHADAMAWIERACALAPDDAGNWALRAMLELSRRRIPAAHDDARRALEIDPEHIEALCAMGACALAKGDVESAREHALWALQIAPEDAGAHELLASVKARQSWLLGLWWRWNAWVASGSTRRALLLLVGTYVLYRAVVITLNANGLEQWSSWVDIGWYAFCAYTWFAMPMFRRSVERELESVRLRPDF